MDKYINKYMDKCMEKYMEKYTDKYMDREMDRLTDIHIERHMERWTDRQTDKGEYLLVSGESNIEGFIDEVKRCQNEEERKEKLLFSTKKCFPAVDEVIKLFLAVTLAVSVAPPGCLTR
jgi:hypothetical protein